MSDAQFSVTGRSIVITGAASGIGRAMAVGLARAGARVTACDIDQAGLASLADQAGTEGIEIRTSSCDVSDAAAVADAVNGHVASFGGLDAAFANAGIAGRLIPAAETTLDDLHRVLRVNLDGAFLVARAAMDVMIPQGHGSIVLTSSVWGERAFEAPIVSYAASKGAISNLVRQLAVELAPQGIRVNGILPAGIISAIADGFYEDDDAVAALAHRIPCKRVVGPEAVVGPAQFLASEASAWVTGHLLPVDGGYLAL